MGNGRVVGIILVVAGVVIGIIAALFLVSGVRSEQLTRSGAILGFGIALLVLVAPLVSFGIVMFVQGRRDAGRQARADVQRRLLDRVRAQGEVAIADLALDMQISQDEVRMLVQELVGLQVFSGYVNWDKGVLYSAEASRLRELSHCENCGGEISLSGKGVVTCRFCGTEYFLS